MSWLLDKIGILDPFFQIKKQSQQIKFRDNLVLLASNIYYIHLFLSFIYSTILIFAQPRLHDRLSLSLAIILIYGFMLVWILLANIICSIVEMPVGIIFFNKIIVKLIIVVYPLVALFAYTFQYFRGIRAVIAYCVYHMGISLLFIMYLCVVCACPDSAEPQYIEDQDDVQRKKAYQEWHKIMRSLY